MSFLELHYVTGAGDKSVSARVLCTGTTGEDGFEILAPPGTLLVRLVTALLADALLVRPAGIYCLDMLRMEAGLPRVGLDIPAGLITPIKASLAWTLDQAKMRNHLMFGWQKLFFQLAKGPKFRRVGLLLDGPAHAGCRLLSNPHRQPIGTLASTAWSPMMEARVAMGYIRQEYAKANKQVLVTVPYNLPMHKMRRKAIASRTRGSAHIRGLRSDYRRLVAACVVPLPFAPHRYPEPERQRKAAARVLGFIPKASAPARRPGTDTSPGAPRAMPRQRRAGPAPAEPSTSDLAAL